MKVSIEREELRHLRGLVGSMEPEPENDVDYEYWCAAMSMLNDMIGKADAPTPTPTPAPRLGVDFAFPRHFVYDSDTPLVTRQEMNEAIKAAVAEAMKQVDNELESLTKETTLVAEAFDDHEQWHETEEVPTKREAKAIVAAAMKAHEEKGHTTGYRKTDTGCWVRCEC